MQHRTTVPLAAVALLAVGVAFARAAPTLISTNGGMTVTDPATGITWLANADLAGNPAFQFPGLQINQNGSMSLGSAEAWVNDLNTMTFGNQTGYLGITDWSLPAANSNYSVAGGCGYSSSSGYFGYGCNAMANQLGNLFYNALGGTARTGVLTNTANASLFSNIQPYLYWSGTTSPSPANGGWSFSFGNGFQGTNANRDSMFVEPEYSATPTATEVEPVGLGASPLPASTSTLVPIQGGALVYDPTLGTSWLANGDLAAEPGFQFGLPINPNGSMDLHTAEQWITDLNTMTFNGQVGYLGHTNWMLPSSAFTNRDCSIPTTGGGNPDYGYNCDGQSSQLGELFYDQLGGTPGADILLLGNAGLGDFTNLQSGLYWSGGPAGIPNGSPTFSMLSGFQGSNFGGGSIGEGNTLFVIPILTPEPPAYALLLCALGVLSRVRQHGRRARG